MNGELEAARVLYREGRAILRDLGQGVLSASTGIDLALVELHGGDLAAAEAAVRADCDFLESVKENYFRSTVAALLARLVRDQGRLEEALELTRVAEAATSEDDVHSQSMWRSTRAPILAVQGNLSGGEALARKAVEFAFTTESVNLQADALAELGWVLRAAGQHAESAEVLDRACALYEAKGDVVALTQCRELRRTS
jgi:ATP/maltotriose-dependent transcriptional regulator MalT